MQLNIVIGLSFIVTIYTFSCGSTNGGKLHIQENTLATKYLLDSIFHYNPESNSSFCINKNLYFRKNNFIKGIDVNENYFSNKDLYLHKKNPFEKRMSQVILPERYNVFADSSQTSNFNELIFLSSFVVLSNKNMLVQVIIFNKEINAYFIYYLELIRNKKNSKIVNYEIYHARAEFLESK